VFVLKSWTKFGVLFAITAVLSVLLYFSWYRYIGVDEIKDDRGDSYGTIAVLEEEVGGEPEGGVGTDRMEEEEEIDEDDRIIVDDAVEIEVENLVQAENK